MFRVCASLNLGAVQGARRAVVPTHNQWLERRNAPKVRLALRVVARKARLRQETLTPTLSRPSGRRSDCSFSLWEKVRMRASSSLIWINQTALLAPCIRTFLATTHTRNKSDRLLRAGACFFMRGPR